VQNEFTKKFALLLLFLLGLTGYLTNKNFHSSGTIIRAREYEMSPKKF
jgi:hypothetical protein